MLISRARSGWAAAVAMVLVAMFAAGARAQTPEGLDIQVREAELDDGGTTEVTVAVTGLTPETSIPDDAFVVREAGETVADVEVSRVEDAPDVTRRVVMIVFDTSGSTAGEPLAGAKQAAIEFVDTVADAGVEVGLVTFSDQATLAEPPTRDTAAVIERIEDLAADGETALFDALLVAARTLQNFPGQHSIVTFSDGADTVSTATLGGALNAAATVEATVSSVTLNTGDLDVAPLQELAATTGGTLAQAEDVDELQSAFAQVAGTFTNQFVLTYTGSRAAGEFDLTVGVTVEGETAESTITLLSPRQGGAVGEPRAIAVSDPGIFAQRRIVVAAMAALGLAVLVILAFILVPAGDQRVARTLERGMRLTRHGEGAGAVSRATPSAVGERAVRFVDRLPKPQGYDEALQQELERAGWPLRAAEFTVMRIGAVLGGVLVGWGLFGIVLLGVLLGVAGWFVPRLLLQQRVQARQARFVAQLPDTLQLLSGALKAGYGILQSIDTVVKESPEPTATEFQRVLVEARLGLALEDALAAMADRIGSEDFRWVTVAINIQRRVGGNLADLLETVSETLRAREQVRRQIQVLSAEGRLSAVILVLLPIGLSGYLFLTNPDYIGQLFGSTVGQIMVVGAVALMAVGVVWMRRLIDIDV